jgi:hypothetical protein
MTEHDSTGADQRGGIEVFLVPVGGDRYELYCEHADEPLDGDDEPPKGFLRRLVQRFKETLAAAEQERRAGRGSVRTARPDQPRSWTHEIRDRSVRWVAEAIAEQRLLWNLRRAKEATLVHPDDVSGDRATAILRAALRKDADRHRFWLVVDSVGFVVSGVFFFVPGPNLIAYYFAFRLVGHYLSLRGARQGLDSTRWSQHPSSPLTELRHAVSLAPPLRALRVKEVASRLKLEHLAAFFERTAVTG